MWIFWCWCFSIVLDTSALPYHKTNKQSKTQFYCASVSGNPPSDITWQTMRIILCTSYFRPFSWLTTKWILIPVMLVSIIITYIYIIYCTYWILLYIPFTRYSFRQIPEIIKIGYYWFSQSGDSQWGGVGGGGVWCGSQSTQNWRVYKVKSFKWFCRRPWLSRFEF